MKREISFQVRNALLCEDVRQEKTEKFFLIGVFSGDIIISKVPARVAIALYMEGALERAGTTNIQIRFSGPGEGEGIVGAEFATSTDGERVVIPIPRLELLFEEAGTFRVDISDDDHTWVTVIEKKVVVTDRVLTPFAAETPQPSEQSPPDVPASSSQPEPSPKGSPKKRRRF